MVWDPEIQVELLRAVPQYRHPDSPPPYMWAAVSSLPRPVTIGGSWSSLHAAQRQNSQLLEVEKYISSCLAEIDAQRSSVMRVKWEEMHGLDVSALVFRTVVQLEGVLFCCHHDTLVVTQELVKINWLRERLSLVSLFSQGLLWEYLARTRNIMDFTGSVILDYIEYPYVGCTMRM